MDGAASQDNDIARESLTALDVLRVAKNAFFWLAIVSVVFHLVAWFGAAPAAIHTSGSTASTDPGAFGSPDSRMSGGNPEGEPAAFLRVVESRLTLIGFVGRASVLVCAGAYIIALLVNLTGRLGGTVGFAKSCVWSLAALAMVTPWVGADSRQIMAFRSAFYGDDELYTLGDGVVSLIRFVLCPLLVAACLLMGQLAFRSAYRRIVAPASGRLSIHEV